MLQQSAIGRSQLTRRFERRTENSICVAGACMFRERWPWMTPQKWVRWCECKQHCAEYWPAVFTDADHIQIRTHLSSGGISEYSSEQCGMYGFPGIPKALQAVFAACITYCSVLHLRNTHWCRVSAISTSAQDTAYFCSTST